MKRQDDGDRLPFYTGLLAAVGVVGLGMAYLLGRGASQRVGALIGVAGAVVSGAAALPLKRRALAKSVKLALGVVVAVFLGRLLLVLVGLLYVRSAGLSPMAFVMGFFGAYFALQWIEVSFVLAEMKRRGQGGV